MKTVVTSLTALALVSLPAFHAQAGDREWATAGKILTGVVAGAVIAKSFEPVPVYSAPPPVVYAHAPTVVYAPPPQVVQVAGLEPGLAPEPEQVSQMSRRVNSTSRSAHRRRRIATRVS